MRFTLFISLLLTIVIPLSAQIQQISDYNGYGISCPGNSDGELSINVQGGTSPYSYQWDMGATTQNQTGLSSGIHDVTITDNNGCQIIAGSFINEPEPMDIRIHTSDYNGFGISCDGETDGTLEAIVSGGVLPYVYNWSNNVSSYDQEDLAAGNYFLTVTDANSCQAIKNITLTEPEALELDLLAVTNYNGFNSSCYRYSDGQVQAIATGGILPYSYQWNNGQSNSTAIDLFSGEHYLSLTDLNGCTVEDSIELTQPTPIIYETSKLDVLECYGDSTGMASISVSGGVEPYVFQWNQFGGDTSSISNIPAGEYFVTIIDLNLCEESMSIVIDQPPLIIPFYRITDITCYGDNNGKIRIDSVIGGFPP